MKALGITILGAGSFYRTKTYEGGRAFAGAVTNPPKGFASLSEAAAAAGLSLAVVEELAERYHFTRAIDRAAPTLNDARDQLSRLRKTLRLLPRLCDLPDGVQVAGGMPLTWHQLAGAMVGLAAHMEKLAAVASARLDERVASVGFDRGGHDNLHRLLFPAPKVDLARACAAAMEAAQPGSATSSPGGRLFNLVLAVHTAVTGDTEGKGLAHAVRLAVLREPAQKSEVHAKTRPRRRAVVPA